MKNLRYNSICLRVLAFLCLILVGGNTAWAEDYVFMNGNYFLGQTTTATTNFVPNASIYTGTSGSTFRNANSYYIRYNSGLAFSTTNSTNFTINNNYLRYGTSNNYYLNLNSTTWRITNTTNNRATAYVVKATNISAGLEDFTITSGNDRIEGLSSNNNYTHSSTSYISGYTKYEFSTRTYYSTNPANNATTTEPAKQTTGITYTWSIEGADGYASVNASGVVNYSTLVPERERTVTLKCTATHTSGATSTATKQITLVNPNVLYNPSISYDNAAGGKVAVTLSYPESDPDVKLYYTTNGDAPSSSSTEYTGPFEVASPTTIKVIAVKGSTVSGIASAVVENITTGVSDGKVVLDDREDHTWTYYQSAENLPAGYPAYLSSPNPRNVKITYRGGGVSNASAVAISGLAGENQNEMVYYKTLEKTVLGMTGNYPYQVISNPFSKRPRANGSTGTNGYYGFAGWKIISGGQYIAEHANNDVLGLDEIIHFTGLDTNYTPNCTSGEIVFEATWTAATVKTGTTAPTFTGGTYETNFWVITGNTGNISLGAPCTMSARYPDGSSAGNYSIGTGGGTTITTTVDNVKIEFLNLNTTGNISADGRNFTMGRGITWSRTAGQITCGNRARAHTVKIESGKYGSLYHFTAAVSGAATDQLVILGNDYDRAKNDNAKLEITGQMIDANANTVTGVASQCYVRSVVKSGSFMTGVSVGTGAYTASYYFGGYGSNNRHVGRRFMTIEGGEFTGSVCGGTDASSHGATARAFDLRVRGNAVINGAVYGGAENAQCYGVRTMIFTGGTVKGWVCAAANGTSNTNGDLTGTTYLYMGGNARVDSNGSHTVINRSVGGNVFAAGCGYQANNATSGLVRNGTNLVVADNTYIERGAYGGGSYGFSANTQTTNIFITGGHVAGKNGGVNGTAWDASVPGGVYGGACQNAGGTINITMTGGLVEGGLYGGSNVTGTIAGKVTMQIDGGQVGTTTTAANVHGGGLGQPTRVNNDVEITLGKTGAARDADGVTIWGDVYGGSALGSVNGTAATTTYHTYVTMNAGYIHGSLYGGALGSSTVAANVYGPVAVKVYGGSVSNTDGTGANGSGAVYGANNINGAPQRSVTVDIYGTNSAPAEGEYALFSVYGGGNAADYSHTYAQNNGYPKVTVHNCDNSIEYVYGGGNQATVPGTNVTIHGGNVIGNVFGGGNNADVTPNGTQVTVAGGRILNVFGGNNNGGEITGDIRINVAEPANSTCPVDVTDLYGGGNKAASNAGQINIGKFHNISNVYGGANQADVTGPITLNITDGCIGTVFGGNNNSGEVTGAVTVNVNWGASAQTGVVASLGNVYGGGNKAPYTGNPTVNIINATTTGSVFGGGLGKTAVVTGDPKVNIGSWTEGSVVIGGDVFGGGDLAAVEGDCNITIRDCDTQILGDLYGGGNAAPVFSTNTTMWGGLVAGNVFGGGNGKDATLNAKGAQVGYTRDDATAGGSGNATTNIFGGTVGVWSGDNCTAGGGVFGGSNTTGDIKGKVVISVEEKQEEVTGASTCSPLKFKEIYGAGNLAAYAGTGITFNLGCAKNLEEVYGGAKQADLNSNITLNITSGKIKKVFGGNNISGKLNGTITVQVDETGCFPVEIDNLYLGGNQAAYSVFGYEDNGTPKTSGDAKAAPVLNIVSCTNIGRVFGGGLGKTATIVGNPVVNANMIKGMPNGVEAAQVGTIGTIFGGGDAAPVVGNTTINIGTEATAKHITGDDQTTAHDVTNLISGDVFGGGLGATAIVHGSTTVKIQGDTNVEGNVYGGGNAAEVEGTTNVQIGEECP